MNKKQEYLISVIGLLGVIIAVLSILLNSDGLALASSLVAILAIAVSMYFVYIDPVVQKVVKKEIKKEQKEISEEKEQISSDERRQSRSAARK